MVDGCFRTQVACGQPGLLHPYSDTIPGRKEVAAKGSNQVPQQGWEDKQRNAAGAERRERVDEREQNKKELRRWGLTTERGTRSRQ